MTDVNKVLIFTGTQRQTVTLPDASLVTPGTIIAIAEVGQWECVHEGKHAFWEKQATIGIRP